MKILIKLSALKSNTQSCMKQQLEVTTLVLNKAGELISQDYKDLHTLVTGNSKCEHY